MKKPTKRLCKKLKPFLSLFIILITLFVVVFSKMEVRRLGYVVWKKTKEYKDIKENYIKDRLQYKKSMSIGRIRNLANDNLMLNAPKKGQVIQMIDGTIAVPQ